MLSLYYYRARYYDPSIGRFISEDPASFQGGDNFYRYANNGPILIADPFGLKSCPKKPCDEWLKDILNLAAEVSRRFEQYAYPTNFLPLWGRNSRAGHLQQLEEKQDKLQDEINDYNNSNCPSPIPIVVLEIATRPTPLVAWTVSASYAAASVCRSGADSKLNGANSGPLGSTASH